MTPSHHRRPLSSVCALLLCLVALGVSGCRRSETNVATGNREQILHLGNGAEPSDLDPQVVTGTKEFSLVEALFEGLVGADPVDLHPVPGAAKSWDISPDKRVYTFHLQPGAKWSNGDPLTAGDFVWSCRRILSPELASEFSFYLFVIKNARAFNQGDLKDFSQVGFRALDDATLQVTLDNPTPYFLDLLRARLYPVHRATVEAAGGALRRGTNWTRPEHFVGNGPFTLQEWTVNKVITVRKNPHYWDAATVRLHEIRFYPYDSLDTEERAFRAGQLHKTYGLPFSKVDSYRRDQPGVVRLDPYARTQYLGVNCRKPVLDNPKVRRALGLAIDREAIVKNLTRGGERAATSLVPPDTGGYTARASLPHDPAAARALLAAAGFPGGHGLPPIEILYNTSEANRVIAEAIQQMWKTDLGVDAVLANQEWKVYLNRRTQQDYQIFEGGWTTTYLDPTGFLELLVGGSPINQHGWANAAYDGALDEAARATDPVARLESLQRAEGILLDEAPLIPLYFWTRVYLLSPSVQGWSPNRLDSHPYKFVWLKE